MSLEEFVNQAISSHKVVIFSKTYCPFCKMAKEAFNKLSEPFYAIELDERNDGDEIQNLLKNVTGVRTVPQVFLKGKYIGGGSDVKELHASGELRKMIDVSA